MFAGAAFTDQADINADNADAVELLTTLNIISGYPDGTFDPEGTVDRAEMAKMIYTIRNGGNDDASAHVDNTTSFTDINGHWAEGYIKYLQNTGIVAGKSATTFDPDSPVTTTEAMKMALALAGYDEKNAELTGPNWSKNTLTLATTIGLTDDVNSAMTAGCTRQDAAQILANVLEATAVRWSSVVTNFVNDSKTGLSYGGDPITVGYKWMDLTIYIGRMVSSGELVIADTDRDGNDDINADDAAGKDRFSIEVDTVNGVDWDRWDWNGNPFRRWNNILTVEDGQDHTDLVGMEVKVLAGDKADEVYGVYATATSQVVETTMDKVDVVESGNSYKLKVDGVTYDTTDAEVFTDGDLDSTDRGTAMQSAAATFTVDGEKVADSVKMIDWDDDGNYETVLTVTTNVAELTFVGSSSVSLGAVGSRDMDDLNPVLSDRALEDEDYTLYDGAAKGDYVVVTKDVYNDTWNIEKAETLEGVINGLVQNERRVRIDGNWYTLANHNDANHTTCVIPGSRTTFTNGDSVTLVLVGDIAYYAKSTYGNDANRPVLMVYDKQVKHDIWGNQRDQVKAIFADGEKETITIDFNNEIKWLGDIEVGKMYHYDINNDDEYSLTSLVDGGEMAGYDRVVADTNGIDKSNSDKTYGGRTIADDAVVFALIGNDDADVYTGKDIKDVISSNDEWGQTEYGQALIASEAGFTYTRMMNIKLGTGIDTGDLYAYVLNSSVASIDSDDTVARAAIARAATGTKVMEYDLWTAEGQIHAIEVTNDNKTDIVEGDIVTYSVVSEGEIEDVTKVTDYEIGAIIGGTEDKISIWTDEDDDNVFTDNILETDEDTVALFVDSKNSDMDEIGQADMNTFNFPASTVGSGSNVRSNVNAKYIMGDDGNVKFILVDTNGKLKGEDTIRVEAYLVSTVAKSISTNATYGISNTTLKDEEGTSVLDKEVQYGDVLTLGYTITNGYKFEATLTGATFASGSRTMTLDDTTASQEITVDGTSQTVSVTFSAVYGNMNVPTKNDGAQITGDADGHKTQTAGSYKVTYNPAPSAGKFTGLSVGDKITVNVTVTNAISSAGVTDTIGLYDGTTLIGEALSFTKADVAGSFKSMTFTVSSDMLGETLTLGTDRETVTGPSVESVKMLNYGKETTTIGDANQLAITFDKALDRAVAENKTNYKVSYDGTNQLTVVDVQVSADRKTVTLTLDVTTNKLSDGAKVMVGSAVTANGVPVVETMDGAKYATGAWTAEDIDIA